MKINNILLETEFGNYKIGSKVIIQKKTKSEDVIGTIIGIDSRNEPMEFRLRVQPFNHQYICDVVYSDEVAYMTPYEAKK